jgi:hypothetical protein
MSIKRRVENAAGEAAPSQGSRSISKAGIFSFDRDLFLSYTYRFVRGILSLLLRGKGLLPQNVMEWGIRTAGMGRQPRKAE